MRAALSLSHVSARPISAISFAYCNTMKNVFMLTHIFKAYSLHQMLMKENYNNTARYPIIPAMP